MYTSQDLRFFKSLGSQQPLVYAADPPNRIGVWCAPNQLQAPQVFTPLPPSAPANGYGVGQLLAVTKTSAYNAPAVGELLVLTQRQPGRNLYTHVGVVVSPNSAVSLPQNRSPRGAPYAHFVWLLVLAIGQHDTTSGALAPFGPQGRSKPSWFMPGGGVCSLAECGFAAIAANPASFQQAVWQAFFGNQANIQVAVPAGHAGQYAGAQQA